MGALFVLFAGLIQDFQTWCRYFIDKLSSGSPFKIKEIYRSWSAAVSRIIHAIKDFIREFQGWWKNPAQSSQPVQPVEPSSTVSL